MGTGIEILIGAFLPPIIDLINKNIAHSRIRFLISLLISILIGVAVSYNELSIDNILGSAAIVFAAANTTYKTYWNTSSIRANLIKNNKHVN